MGPTHGTSHTLTRPVVWSRQPSLSGASPVAVAVPVAGPAVVAVPGNGPGRDRSRWAHARSRWQSGHRPGPRWPSWAPGNPRPWLFPTRPGGRHCGRLGRRGWWLARVGLGTAVRVRPRTRRCGATRCGSARLPVGPPCGAWVPQSRKPRLAGRGCLSVQQHRHVSQHGVHMEVMRLPPRWQS